MHIFNAWKDLEFSSGVRKNMTIDSVYPLPFKNIFFGGNQSENIPVDALSKESYSWITFTFTR